MTDPCQAPCCVSPGVTGRPHASTHTTSATPISRDAGRFLRRAVEPVVPAVTTALVVGGGAAGAATAILLAEAGVAVDLVEIKPEPTAVGSGITLQGNALRVLRQLGVWEHVRAAGYAFDSLGLRAPDPAGTLIAEIPDVRTGGDDLPATLGMPRPELARILLE